MIITLDLMALCLGISFPSAFLDSDTLVLLSVCVFDVLKLIVAVFIC